MPAGVILGFVVLFALILLSVSVGLKFFDARRKKQVAHMLHTAAGEPVVTITNLLKEIEPDKQTGLKQVLVSLHFTRHAQEQLQQAGMSWSSTRLLVTMLVMSVPGAILGSVMPFLFNGVTTAFVVGCVFALLP